jgi:hypothetical protein
MAVKLYSENKLILIIVGAYVQPTNKKLINVNLITLLKEIRNWYINPSIVVFGDMNTTNLTQLESKLNLKLIETSHLHTREQVKNDILKKSTLDLFFTNLKADKLMTPKQIWIWPLSNDGKIQTNKFKPIHKLCIKQLNRKAKHKEISKLLENENWPLYPPKLCNLVKIKRIRAYVGYNQKKIHQIFHSNTSWHLKENLIQTLDNESYLLFLQELKENGNKNDRNFYKKLQAILKYKTTSKIAEQISQNGAYWLKMNPWNEYIVFF